MQFCSLTLNEATALREYFYKMKSYTCDYTVGGMLMWREFYDMECAKEFDSFIVRLKNSGGEYFYSLPLSDNIEESIKHLIEEDEGEVVRFCTIPEEYLDLFYNCGVGVNHYSQPEYSDYLYNVEDLIYLQGKKYSGQRNQINQFLKKYPQWRFEPMTAELVDSVKIFFQNLHQGESGNSTKDEETRMVFDVLNNMDKYKMIGGILYVDDDIVAFALGEIIRDVLYTHIERSDKRYKGAPQMLTNQFVKLFGEGVSYVNREEDMGDEGLRISKKSYHPCKMLEKYIVEVSK